MSQKLYQVKARPRKTTQYICEMCQTPFEASAVARWCPECRIKRYRSTASTRAAEQSKAMRQSTARQALRAAPPELGLVVGFGSDTRHDHADPAQQRQQALAAAMDPWAGSACRRDPVGPQPLNREPLNQPTPKSQETPTMANTHAHPPKPTGTLICCDCQQPTPRTGNCQKRCPSCAETNKDLIRAKHIAKKLATAIPRPIGRPPKAKAAAAEPSPSAVARGLAGEPPALPGTPERLLGSVTPEPTPVPEPTGAGAPVSQGSTVALLAPMRTVLDGLSSRHGLIAQRAMAADTALAQLQEAMA